MVKHIETPGCVMITTIYDDDFWIFLEIIMFFDSKILKDVASGCKRAQRTSQSGAEGREGWSER